MRILRIFVLTFALVGLAACGSRSTTGPGPGSFGPVLSGTVSSSGGLYYINDGGTATYLATPDGYDPAINMSWWYSGLSTPAAYMYSDGNVRAIAGMKSSGATFAGISGTPAWGLPTGGSATYNGSFSGTYYRYGFYNQNWNADGQMSNTVNFSNGTVAGSGSGNYNSSLTISGTITGTKFYGTAWFSAQDSGGQAVVPMAGGFFGYNTMAGIYRGGTVAGVFHGR